MAKSSERVGSGFCSCLLTFTFRILLILTIILLFPGLPPKVEFSHYSLNITPVVLNNKLNNAVKYKTGELTGPEDIAVWHGELYFTDRSGYVIRHHRGMILPVIRFGKDCRGLHQEHICGRPLGLRITPDGTFYVADAYYGVFKVNHLIKNPGDNTTVETLAAINDPIDGTPPKIPNSLAVSKSGDVYWTDSSTSHRLYDGVYTLLSNGNGRLIKYDAKKGKNEVLMKDLHFPNGVALSGDESFLVYAETFRARLMKYHLKGPKTGQSEVFAELPGFPDNVDFTENRFVVALITVPDTLVQTLPEWPVIRKLVSRIFTLVELFLEEVDSLYPSDLLQTISHKIGHFETVQLVSNSPVIVIEFSADGKQLQVLSATDNNISGISCMKRFEGWYYLGSPFNNYLARVRI